MGCGWKFEATQKTLQTEDNQLSVKMLCEIAGVSRSGYYRWINSADVGEEREQKDREDFKLILKAYNQRRYRKGGTEHLYVHGSLESSGHHECKENKTTDR
ncbi:MAG: hypothetical protein HFE76_16310 [Firmicutes bacterium]|nr:hypothetical protein [Bacillota bacterium]